MSQAAKRKERPEAETGARLAELYEAHARMVVGLSRLLLRDPDEAEDAAQQAFLSAYRSMLRGTVPRRPGPWLSQITRNECLARLAQRERIADPVGDLEDSLPARGETAELAERRSQMDELTRAIGELPDRQREAVVLRDFYGLSYREVAAALTVSVPVAESLLFRARRKLKAGVGGVPRVAHGVWAMPMALHGELSRLVPGFESTSAPLAAATGTGMGAAALAKLATVPGASVAKIAALPVGAKVALATTATVVAVGTGAGVPIGQHIAGADSSSDPLASAVLLEAGLDTDDVFPNGPGGTAPGAHEPASRVRSPSDDGAAGGSRGSGSSSAGPGRQHGDDDDRSGPGGGGRDDDDRSGPGNGGADGDRSGPGGGGGDDDDRAGSGGGGSVGDTARGDDRDDRTANRGPDHERGGRGDGENGGRGDGERGGQSDSSGTASTAPTGSGVPTDDDRSGDGRGGSDGSGGGSGSQGTSSSGPSGGASSGQDDAGDARSGSGGGSGKGAGPSSDGDDTSGGSDGASESGSGGGSSGSGSGSDHG
ncbi:MAG: RNA polymerase sigma factor [Gaiellales bacterium]